MKAYFNIVASYVCVCFICCMNFTCACSLAFGQRATGPSRVCEGSDVTLQCVIVFIIADNITTVQSTVWTIAPDGTLATLLPNHRVVFNSTTGVFTDLVITNVTLEDDNTVFTCSAIGATITSSVVLNVTGNMCTLTREHSYLLTYSYAYILQCT